ncbi:MAG: NAD(P)-dependent oxidoreductase [Muribaculaceae bacterium]|nr:NAD(P)-dependent oxidoreductase [Muribaculaceae bacterium]
MKETILITGAGPNGVTGRRIKEQIEKKGEYHVLAPSSKELDLTDKGAVDKYFQERKIDYVIHCALVAPSRGHDTTDEAKEVEDNLRMYFNLASHSEDFKKMFYFGSGAEFDKSHDIVNAKEEDAIKIVPADKYGFIKSILNKHAINSKNIYNLRLFGTINPFEPANKNVISLLCDKALKNNPFDLNIDCLFSFVDIDDVISFIEYAMKDDLLHHDYNIVGERKVYISFIAELIKQISGSKKPIIFKNKTIGKEYTGSDERWLREFKKRTPISDSIKKVYEHFQKNF